jgi:hypothetical protein
MTMKPDIKSGYVYAPLIPHEKGHEEHVHVFCFDQQKRNLLYLMAPHAVSLKEVSRMSEIAKDIHLMMSRDMREALRKSPRSFLRWLVENDYPTMAIFQSAPANFISIMSETVKQLSRQVEEEAVVRVAFGR